MYPPTWKRWLILAFGLLENLVFSGSILGWSALNYMLKAEGIFSDVCTNVHSSNFVTISPTVNSTSSLYSNLNSNDLVNNYINYSIIPELPDLPDHLANYTQRKQVSESL